MGYMNLWTGKDDMIKQGRDLPLLYHETNRQPVKDHFIFQLIFFLSI
jgi:hypothetical protein